MDTDNERPAAKIDLKPVSIQWLDTGPGPCCRCAKAVGTGPVGFTAEEPAGPLCDVCLLEQKQDLGMLMWMVLVVRGSAAYAIAEPDSWRADQCMMMLMTFAKIYHAGAVWPHRAAVPLDQELKGSPAPVSWEALVKMLATPPN